MKAPDVGEPRPDKVRSHTLLLATGRSHNFLTPCTSAVAVCHWPQRPFFRGHRRDQTT
jgi:hypothetical protein